MALEERIGIVVKELGFTDDSCIRDWNSDERLGLLVNSCIEKSGKGERLEFTCIRKMKEQG